MPMRSRWWSLWLALLALALLTVKALSKRDDWSGAILFGVVIVATVGGYFAGRRLFRNRLRRWALLGDWTPVERPWPWEPPPRGVIKVRRAWERRIDGLPVTFGELRWKGNAFAGMVLLHGGSGAFVIVRLPLPSPPMALRHAFEPVGGSPRLDQPALREAYLAGDIPTWTVRDDELYTIEARDAWFDPAMADEAVRRALHIVRLLDLGPDTTTGVAPGTE
jgi:hypothetical protein